MAENVIAMAKRSYSFRDRYLSLIDHSADVAAVMEALLRLPTINRRLARLAERDAPFDEVTSQRLCALVAVHDIGKVNNGFQNRIHDRTGKQAGHIGPIVSLLFAGGSNLGKKTFKPLNRAMKDAIGWTTWESWCQECDNPAALEDILRAVFGHHGGPPGESSFLADDFPLWGANPDYDPIAEAAAVAAGIRRWFPRAFETGGPPLPEAPRFLHAFAGLVVLTDWLGSDDTVFRYPLAPDEMPGGGDRMAFSRAQAAAVVTARHLDPGDRRRAARGLDFSFAALFDGKTPRPAQAAILEADCPDGGQVMVLEAETGSGKTEAAILHFLRLLRDDKVDGLYFALPTRASATQIQARLQRDLARILGPAAPPVGLAVPGYLRVDDAEGQALPRFRVQWPDDRGDHFHDRGWAVEQPRRYLAGAVMVGTIDQLLLGGLKVKHAHLRSSAMLRQLLVIDEVHASDPYMDRLLRGVLDQHRAAGGYALLMSATLGGDMRTKLVTGDGRARLSFETALATRYPALHASVGAVPPVSSDPCGRQPKTVELSLHEAAADLSPLVARATEAAAAGARVLIIRNKVADAIAVQAALEERLGAGSALLVRCQGLAAPHHARYAVDDRKLLDIALEQALGKPAGVGGVIAVTTQTAEQSLDLDADWMVSDLCPVDVLLQRIGRLHRHVRDRPVGFETARLTVIAPAVRSAGRQPLGFGSVYEDLVVLAATRRLLTEKPRWIIPDMNRDLVETATHPDQRRALAEALGGDWVQHWMAITGQASATSNVAFANSIKWTDHPEPVVSDETAGGIRTRLGLDNRRAVLPEPMPGPFGAPVRDFSIPGWLVGEAVPLDAAPEAVVVRGDGLAFRFGDMPFVYDRWGLRPAEKD